MAAADSLIAAWHQKFTTNFLRPVTAIRNARKLDNPAIQEDPDWTPLLVTPAHPDYPSGHCAYEGAAIRVLQLFFGTDQTKASYTYPPNAITLRWASYSQMANEVGDARVWGGIHTRTADEHADMVGKKIGE
jgi:PAP2 superfamily